MAIPLRLALAPIIGFLFGWFLDRRLGIFPWLTSGLLLLGFVAGARELKILVKRTEEKKDEGQP